MHDARDQIEATNPVEALTAATVRATGKVLFRPAEAAKLLSISRSRAYELIKLGKLPAIRFDGRFAIRVDDLVTCILDLQHTGEGDE